MNTFKPKKVITNRPPSTPSSKRAFSLRRDDSGSEITDVAMDGRMERKKEILKDEAIFSLPETPKQKSRLPQISARNFSDTIERSSELFTNLRLKKGSEHSQDLNSRLIKHSVVGIFRERAKPKNNNIHIGNGPNLINKFINNKASPVRDTSFTHL